MVSILKNLKVLFLICSLAISAAAVTCTNSGGDFTNVQNALNAGGTVTISGTCSLGTNTLNLGSNTTVNGTATLNYSGSGFIFQSPGSNNTITGLTLNGGGIFLSKNDTAHHTGQGGWTITNNTIQNTTSEGVRVDHILGRDSPNNHSNISNNHFSNINNWGVFWGSGIDNVLIDNNTFTGITLNPLKGFNDWFSGFTDPYTATNIKISNNDMQQFHRIAFENQGTVGGCPGGCNSGQVWSTGTIISGNFVHNYPANADRNVWGYSLFWGAATQVINNTVVNNKIVPTNQLGIGYEWAGFNNSLFQGNVERANSSFVVAVTTGFTSIGGVPCSVATCTVTYANNIFINNPTPLQTNPIYGQGENQLAWDQVNYVHKPDYISGSPGTISEASNISLAYTSPDHQTLASGSSGTWNTSVVSNLSIRSMQFFLDGSSTAAVTQQIQDVNNNFTIDQKWLYHATINATSLTTGTHSIIAKATDVSGAVQTQTQTFTVGTGASLINTFTASPTTITAGSSSTLAWTYSGTVTSASIDNGVGSVFSLSSTSVSPTATTTYILTATGPSGTFTATATVTVTGGTGPLISTFGASPASIAAGASSTLSWTYSGTVTAASINNGVGSVLSLSSKSVSPGATTTYTLTATGPSGTATATTTVTVSVTGGPGTPQPASWPTVATDSNLLTAADHSTTTLSTGINSSTLSIPVVSASTFIPFQVATVDSEQMKLCAVTTGLLTVCASGRGFAGTSAASHSTGAFVNGRIVAVYHNQVATELAALEPAFLATGYGFGNVSINGAAWRNHAATLADLLVATDGARATLAANISPTSNTMTLTSPQFIVQNQVVTMDGEEIKIANISGPTYTIIRGWDNTQPVAHNAGASMLGLLSSTYWNVIVNELVSLEGNMWGLNGSTPSCPCAPVTGTSWPNHAATLAELGVAGSTVTISAASQMRLIAEFEALEADINAHPTPVAPSKFLILHDLPGQIASPTFLQANHTYVDTLPIDGVVVYVRDPSLNNVSATIMQPTAISFATIQTMLSPLSSITWTHVKNNFALMYWGPGWSDLFNDSKWATVTQNMANYAQAIRNIGLKGIFFDNENYANYGNYGDLTCASPHTLFECQAKMTARGNQVMAAMISQFPTIVVFSTHDPSISDNTFFAQSQFATVNNVAFANQLVGPFIAGIVQATQGTGASFVSGGEDPSFSWHTSTQFNDIYQYQKFGVANDSLAPNDLLSRSAGAHGFIPSALRAAWSSLVSGSLGVRDLDNLDPTNNLPTTLTSTLTNALARADKYVWLYMETWSAGASPPHPTMLVPPGSEADAAPQAWLDAIRAAHP